MGELGTEEVLERAALPSDSGDNILRPQRMADFVGQRKVVDNLALFIKAAKARGETMDHVLFSGMPGLGKTTLAHLIADELGVSMHAASGPMLEKPGDLVGILTRLEPGAVLFIDEIHRLPRAAEEFLYSAMEDYYLDVVLEPGVQSRSVRLTLQKFTLVGATTREGLLTAPFRARFGVLERLDPYPECELAEIVLRSAVRLGVGIDEAACDLVAARARGTPRIANRILRRLRDVAEVKGRGRVSVAVAEAGLEMLGIDGYGLTEMDRRILRCIADHDGAAGLKTVAVAVGEEEDTIEDTYEPHLIRQGLLRKTPRGRVITERGLEAAGLHVSGRVQQAG
ncbi:MAG: Holliday junction branch migration DNA helicase RuvB [Planctomycetes bacterium]|nr:Holliday junction branch migration DNA helicase RuvB [Planctomycetota bacterium]